MALQQLRGALGADWEAHFQELPVCQSKYTDVHGLAYLVDGARDPAVWDQKTCEKRWRQLAKRVYSHDPTEKTKFQEAESLRDELRTLLEVDSCKRAELLGVDCRRHAPHPPSDALSPASVTTCARRLAEHRDASLLERLARLGDAVLAALEPERCRLCISEILYSMHDQVADLLCSPQPRAALDDGWQRPPRAHSRCLPLNEAAHAKYRETRSREDMPYDHFRLTALVSGEAHDDTAFARSWEETRASSDAAYCQARIERCLARFAAALAPAPPAFTPLPCPLPPCAGPLSLTAFSVRAGSGEERKTWPSRRQVVCEARRSLRLAARRCQST